ncbi:hypothetical protein DFQ28_006759 [Apophysomyces sp. BC1034]|nr:hypothetical protein DFQ30_004885 [Apophysomyces sp. BC1015]KAG0180076.1 hypothetical protein DFQ29_001258 [Apophysomyces sp. BC1021]KAG0193018.1 hypothetical protein DFQ28_006759 [Apophysomyces sp. BC1034]
MPDTDDTQHMEGLTHQPEAVKDEPAAAVLAGKTDVKQSAQVDDGATPTEESAAVESVPGSPVNTNTAPEEATGNTEQTTPQATLEGALREGDSSEPIENKNTNDKRAVEVDVPLTAVKEVDAAQPETDTKAYNTEEIDAEAPAAVRDDNADDDTVTKSVDHVNPDQSKRSGGQMQRTLALIKPDAMQANKADDIIRKIEEAEFTVVKQQEVSLSLEQSRLFYREHEGKPFYNELTQWMSSRSIYALVLEKENGVQAWRTLMGPTDSDKARTIEPNSIRALFGTDGSHNATHGSDCLTSAEREIDIIFGSGDSENAKIDKTVEEDAKPGKELEQDTVPVKEEESSEITTEEVETVVKTLLVVDKQETVKIETTETSETTENTSVAISEENVALPSKETQEDTSDVKLSTDTPVISKTIEESDEPKLAENAIAEAKDAEGVSSKKDTDEKQLSVVEEVVEEVKEEVKKTLELIEEQKVLEEEDEDVNVPAAKKGDDEKPTDQDDGTKEKVEEVNALQKPENETKEVDDSIKVTEEVTALEIKEVTTTTTKIGTGILPAEKTLDEENTEAISKAIPDITDSTEEASTKDDCEQDDVHIKAEAKTSTEDNTPEISESTTKVLDVTEIAKNHDILEVSEEVHNVNVVETEASTSKMDEDKITEPALPSTEKNINVDNDKQAEEETDNNNTREVSTSENEILPSKEDNDTHNVSTEAESVPLNNDNTPDATLIKTETELPKDESNVIDVEVSELTTVPLKEDDTHCSETTEADSVSPKKADSASKPKPKDVKEAIKEAKPKSPSRSPARLAVGAHAPTKKSPTSSKTKLESGTSSAGVSVKKPAVKSEPKSKIATSSTGRSAIATSTKRTAVSSSNAHAGEEQGKKTTTATATKVPRVPRVAMLVKKPAASKPDDAAEDKPKKPATKSVVSRLTAPTTASARKKPTETEASKATGTTTTKTVRTIKRSLAATSTAPGSAKKTSPSSTIDKTAAATRTAIATRLTRTTRATATTAESSKKPVDTAGATATPKRVIRRVPATAASQKAASAADGATKPLRSAANGGLAKSAVSSRGTVSAAKVNQQTRTAKTAVKKPIKSKEGVDVDASSSDVASTAASQTESNATSEVDSNEASAMDSSNDASLVDSAEASVVDSAEASVVEDVTTTLSEEVRETTTVHVESTVSVEISKAVEESSEVHDDEVAAVTHNENNLTTLQEHNESVASSSLSSSRPITPEIAQLRNRFESLNAESRSSSTPKDLRSKSPNRVKDMINRFTG